MRDIHAMNGLKLLLATIMNGAAVIAFVAAGAVRWPETVAVALAAIAGGWAGAKGANRVDQRVIKGFVVALGAAMSIYFFWRGA